MRVLSAVALLLSGLAAGTAWAAEPSLPFDTAPVEQKTLVQERTFDAVIEAVNQATVSAQTSGRIVEINFDVDDYVTKDTVIVRFRDKEQRAAVEAARARYEEARSSFERIKDLIERKLASKAEYDKAEAGLRAAKAALAQAEEQLEHTVVRAPYSGIVVKRHVELGETANPGQPLMTGLSLEQLRAVANVSQAYIDKIRGRAQARILLPGGSSIESSQITVSPYADPQSHTFRVRVDLPEGQHGVYPGMFVKAAFAVGEDTGLVVPAEAVVYRSEVTAVYTVDGQGAIIFRQIRSGRRLGDQVEVLAGLQQGDRVALDPVRAGVYLKKIRAGESE